MTKKSAATPALSAAAAVKRVGFMYMFEVIGSLTNKRCSESKQDNPQDPTTFKPKYLMSCCWSPYTMVYCLEVMLHILDYPSPWCRFPSRMVDPHAFA